MKCVRSVVGAPRVGWRLVVTVVLAVLTVVLSVVLEHAHLSHLREVAALQAEQQDTTASLEQFQATLTIISRAMSTLPLAVLGIWLWYALAAWSYHSLPTAPDEVGGAGDA